MIRSLLVSLLISLLAFTAQAGFLIEPYVGYKSTSLDGKLVATSEDISGKTGGSFFGGRLGYKYLGFWGALDYETGTQKYKPKDTSFFEADITTEIGYLTLGYDLPFLLRFWASYGLTASQKYKFEDDSESTYKKGTAMKLGVGLKWIPFTSLNLEYFSYEAKEREDSSSKVPVSDFANPFKNSGLMISLSVPFNL